MFGDIWALCLDSGGTLLNLVLSTFIIYHGVILRDLVTCIWAGIIYVGSIRLTGFWIWPVYFGKPGGSGNFLTTSASNSGLEFN